MKAENDDDLYEGQRSTEVKYNKLHSTATKQRSNIETLFDGYETWSEEPLMQAEDDDLNGGQRSTEVKI